MTNVLPAHLLIVDDEKEIAKALKLMLTPVTPNISVAENGLEALHLIKSGQIDAVISDITMPKMTGLQLLAEIRALGMQTPFVILTGYADKENILEALRLDATDFLEKPFQRKQVVEIATQILELGKSLRQMENDVDEVFSNSEIPADQQVRLKQIKKVVLGMRLNRKVYDKKPA